MERANRRYVVPGRLTAWTVGGGVLAVASWALVAFADGFHSPLMVYKDPEEFFEKHKEELGFGSGDSSGESDTLASLESMQKRLSELKVRVRILRTNREEREAVQAEIEELTKAIEERARSTMIPGQTKADKQKWFIQELIRSAQYINEVNVRPEEFPSFTRDRNGAREGISRIFVQLGPQGVPYLWDTIVQELRFAARDISPEAKKLSERLVIVQMEIEKLRMGPAPDIQPDRARMQLESLESERQEILAKITALNDPHEEGMERNRDLIKQLEDIIVEIGAPAAAFLAADLSHRNRAVASHAEFLLRRIGPPAIPSIVFQLTIRNRERDASRFLQKWTGEDFGVDTVAWMAYFRKQGVRFPGDAETKPAVESVGPAPSASKPPVEPPSPPPLLEINRRTPLDPTVIEEEEDR